MNILVLGGYGNFGARITRALVVDHRCRLFIAGRDGDRAAAHCAALRQVEGATNPEPLALDQHGPELAALLKRLDIHLLIHTSGPYQGQDYRVAQACIGAGVHYVDLADGRRFVAGIGVLDEAARAGGTCVISGASTLPALSAAVLDAHRDGFSRLDSIDVGIAPAQRATRGIATLAGVLGYCGRPFLAWERGAWRNVYGWQDLGTCRYPALGMRLLLRCDVPDLELFPRRYDVVDRVRFDAALELHVVQLGFWCLSWLSRLGLVPNPVRLAPLLFRIGAVLDAFGGDTGGMHVRLTGVDHAARSRVLTWYLTARAGCGPEIPALPAIMLARRMAGGVVPPPGARACVGLISLAEFTQALAPLPISLDVVEDHP